MVHVNVILLSILSLGDSDAPETCCHALSGLCRIRTESRQHRMINEQDLCRIRGMTKMVLKRYNQDLTQGSNIDNGFAAMLSSNSVQYLGNLVKLPACPSHRGALPPWTLESKELSQAAA
ncbi:uncharacterized protein LY89DRAFT_122308 [Mollisia scopiformis]|uniref:Uncharacterized protein n=1 Tax=Mollisia scopiformis TaxID=149040 RepID=A0A194X3P4_MOLSC|nr:uncharacterized protein LY89DRAFT_122308 [Mollisia scopiformis]KUJ14786.1 hypothetical protein LY89DRAFT_122308 [Mollisia scopiformis]